MSESRDRHATELDYQDLMDNFHKLHETIDLAKERKDIDFLEAINRLLTEAIKDVKQ